VPLITTDYTSTDCHCKDQTDRLTSKLAVIVHDGTLRWHNSMYCDVTCQHTQGGPVSCQESTYTGWSSYLSRVNIYTVVQLPVKSQHIQGESHTTLHSRFLADVSSVLFSLVTKLFFKLKLKINYESKVK